MSLSREYPDWMDVSGRRRAAGVPGWIRTVARTLVVLLPTLIAAAYYGGIAADRDVSEARFVIRTANKPTNVLGGLTALLQFAGMSRSQDDAYAVRDFLTSRDAMKQLSDEVNLTEIYGRPEADFVTRYPSFLYHESTEELYRYFQRVLTVTVNNSTGLTTLRVEAYRAADAQRVAQTLLRLGEGLVNKLNTRMQEDALRVSTAELAHAEERRVSNQLAIVSFRNKELILDPDKSSAMIVELIGQLSTQLAETGTQIAETEGNSRNSPQLQSLRQRAAALERQIAIERARVTNGSDGLAAKIAEYERLMLEREFSIRMLAQAATNLEVARTEARRQQLFLERVVEPGLPDEATMPRRWRSVLVIFGFNVIGAGVLWLIGTGVREHSSSAGH